MTSDEIVFQKQCAEVIQQARAGYEFSVLMSDGHLAINQFGLQPNPSEVVVYELITMEMYFFQVRRLPR